MGVPKFYRWLSERYPLINSIIDSPLLPPFDCLYLDLNGVIHGATHGNEGVSKKQTDKDVVLTTMEYIDKMVKIIKPGKLLYMAIDGVAPRAKMNQQRSRRFRAARDAEEAKREAAARGEEILADDVFDSNCITPGTEFMEMISGHLRYLVQKKLREDPVWQRFRVFFSGAEVIGEGEHKIMNFIRARKLEPDYDPNLHHCMAGLDADLIMLSLASHEPHFCLLREIVDFLAFKQNKMGTKTETIDPNKVKFQLLHINILREYLEIDMKPPKSAELTFDYDGERVIDDFVLLSALCGNDFMPHLPSLDIGEGALDDILKTYRTSLPSWGGYLCEGGLINFERLEKLLVIMGKKEAEVFQKRKDEAEKIAKKRNKGSRNNRAAADVYLNDNSNTHIDNDEPLSPTVGVNGNDDDLEMDYNDITDAQKSAADAELFAGAARRLADHKRLAALGSTSSTTPSDSEVSDIDDTDEDIPEFYLTDEDFKGRYYLEKFGITYQRGSAIDDQFLQDAVSAFIHALQWVALYYYRGVPSWRWFYPLHYAPMTSDLVNLSSIPLAFRLDQPFHPFEQLLGCLPAASSKFLPACYSALMTNPDSPLIDSYPALDTVGIDMNGKRNAWEGVMLVPFMGEADMLKAVKERCTDNLLTDKERHRNQFGTEWEFWYDPSSTDTVTSFDPKAFPDLPFSNTRRRTYETPYLPVLTTRATATALKLHGLSSPDIIDHTSLISVREGMDGSAHLFFARPRPGCVVPGVGFSSLHSLYFSTSLAAVGLNIFGSKSRKVSMILALTNMMTGNTEEEEDDNNLLSSLAEYGDMHATSGHGRNHHYSHDHDRPSTMTHLSSHNHHHGSSTNNHTFLSPTTVASSTPSLDSLPSPTNDALATVPSAMKYVHQPRFSTDYVAQSTVKLATTDQPLQTLSALTQWQLTHPGETVSARKIAEMLMGKQFYCDWPHLRACLVVRVRDSFEECNYNEMGNDSNRIKCRNLSTDEQVNFSQEANALRIAILSGGTGLKPCGIRIGEISVIVSVRKLEGMRRDPVTGAITPVYGTANDQLANVPLQLLLSNHPHPDSRLESQGAQSLRDRFPVTSKVMVVKGEHKGSLATITGYTGTDGNESGLELDVSVPPLEAPFGITIRDTLVDAHYDSRKAAASLRISERTFNKLTGSIIIKHGRGFNATVIDIGLNLKVQKRLYLPGYVRPVSGANRVAWMSGSDASTSIASSTPSRGSGGVWEFTERAIAIVASYQKKFPEVVGVLEASPDAPVYGVKDFPNGMEGLSKLRRWIEQLETFHLPLLPIGASLLSPKAIPVIEKAAEGVRSAAENNSTVKKLSNVPPMNVYTQEINAYAVGTISEGEGSAIAESTSGWTDTILPVLGDRVANLAYKRAPFGLRGTVIAIYPQTGYVEVVFDAEFIGGTTLSGHCSKGRGGLVQWSAVLCVSRDGIKRTNDYLPSSSPALSSNVYTDNDIDRFDNGPRGKINKTVSAPVPSNQYNKNTSNNYQQTSPVMIKGRTSSVPVPTVPPVTTTTHATSSTNGRVANGPTQTGGFKHNSKGHHQQATDTAAITTSVIYDMVGISNQVDFYFSDGNLPRDEFMKNQLAKDTTGQGWVPITILTTFNRLKQSANGDPDIIAAAVAEHSKFLVVSPDRKMVRRVKPWNGPKQKQNGGSGNPASTVSPAVVPVSTPTLAPSVAALFQAASSPAIVPTASPTVASSVPRPTGGIDMSTYWSQLMATSSTTATTTTTVVPPPIATPAPLPVATVPAITSPTVSTPSSSTADERAHFNTLLQTLQRTNISTPSSAPSNLSNLLVPSQGTSSPNVLTPFLVAPTGTPTVVPTKPVETKPAPTTTVASTSSGGSGLLMPSQLLAARAAEKKKKDSGTPKE